MGELHLEIIKNRLLRDFNLNVKVHKPRVSYRETIARAVEVDGECHRHDQRRACTRPRCALRMEPLPTAAGVRGRATRSTTACRASMLTAVLEELENAAQGGGVLGFPLMKVKVTLLGGEVHETDSTEIAFRTAAAAPSTQALREAGTVLLEPIMKLEITTPDEHLGDFVGDLQQRRAIITQTQNRGHMTVIEAEAPLAELFGYSSAMRSLSQGRASCSMEPSTYAAAPDEVLKRFL